MAKYKELIEKAKEVQHFSSDNQLALRMGVSRSYISNWKSGYSNPDGFNTIILMDLANVTPREAMRMINRGFIRMSMLPVTALAGIALPYCYDALKHCILCSIGGKYKNQLGFNFGQYKT